MQAIRQAEIKTSGEIRVHLEAKANKAPLERAKEVFHLLKMDNTKEENGVLLYVAVQEKTFAIYGDRGIDRAVPKGFWTSTKDIMEAAFKRGDFKQGIVDGVLRAGEELALHFPWDIEDRNELSDEVSKA